MGGLPGSPGHIHLQDLGTVNCQKGSGPASILSQLSAPGLEGMFQGEEVKASQLLCGYITESKLGGVGVARLVLPSVLGSVSPGCCIQAV